jgi:hypothetical protein
MAWWEMDENGDQVLVARKRGFPYATVGMFHGGDGTVLFTAKTFVSPVKVFFSTEEEAELYVDTVLAKICADVSYIPRLYA